MSFIYAAKYGPEDLRQSPNLVIPTAVTIKDHNTSTTSVLYADRLKTAGANPLNVNVSPGVAGVDTYGNLTFFGDTNKTYDAYLTLPGGSTVVIYNLSPMIDAADIPQNVLSQTGGTMTGDQVFSQGASAVFNVGGVLYRVGPDANGNIGFIATTNVVIPAAPVLGTLQAGNAQVLIPWQASINAVSYTVLVNNVAYATTTATSELVTGLTNGTSYSFAVIPNGATTSGPASVTVTATPAAGSTPVVTVPPAPTLVATAGIQSASGKATGVAGITSWRFTRQIPGGTTTGISMVGGDNEANGYANSLVLNKPAGAVAGNVAYIAATGYTTVTATTPTGFTLIKHNDNGTNSSMYAWRRVLDGTEGTTFTVAFSASNQCTATLVVLSGVNGTTPEDVTPAAYVSGTTSISTSTQTAVSASDGVLLIAGAGLQQNITIGVPSGFTKLEEAWGANLYTTSTIALGTGGAAGSTLGPYTVSLGASNGGQVMFIALKATSAAASPETTFQTNAGSTFGDNALTAGTTYDYRVYATNASGESPSSNMVAVVPTAPAIVTTAPGAPTNVVGSPGSGQITWTWAAPANTGNTPITSYTVTTSGGIAPVTVTATQQSGLVLTTAVVTGLANGTAYTATVTATNVVGTGGASAVSGAVTPAAGIVISSNAFNSIFQGTYRWDDGDFGPTGEHPGTNADYAAWVGKPTSNMAVTCFLNLTQGRPSQSLTDYRSGMPARAKAAGFSTICLGNVWCVPYVVGTQTGQALTTYADMASGTWNADFALLAQNLAAVGFSKPLHIRGPHEFNILAPYQAAAFADPANFIKTCQIGYGYMKEYNPTSLVYFNPTGPFYQSSDGSGDPKKSPAYGFYWGNNYCDVIAADVYDGYVNNGAPAGTRFTLAQQQALWTSQTLPMLEATKAFAVMAGKPMAFPEWGLRIWQTNAGGDNGYFVTQCVNWMANNASDIVYHSFWEDVATDGNPADSYVCGVFDANDGPQPLYPDRSQSRAAFLQGMGVANYATNTGYAYSAADSGKYTAG